MIQRFFSSRRRRIIIPVAVFVAAAGCAGPSAAETHVVEIEGFAFSPAELNVAVGDTVVWINRDVAPHTATASDGSFDSGRLRKNDEWSVVIEAAGATDYICDFHPTMRGVINAD